MAFKIIGMVLVLLSCGLTGFMLSFRESYRINDLLEMKKGLSILKSEIEYALNPLPQALQNVALRTAAPLNGFFQSVSEKLSQKMGEAPGEIWRESLYSGLSKSWLVPEDILAMEQMGRTLGYLDRSLQMNTISLAILYIDEKTRLLGETAAKNSKMFKSIGVIAGVIVVVVLL